MILYNTLPRTRLQLHLYHITNYCYPVYPVISKNCTQIVNNNIPKEITDKLLVKKDNTHGKTTTF